MEDRVEQRKRPTSFLTSDVEAPSKTWMGGKLTSPPIGMGDAWTESHPTCSR